MAHRVISFFVGGFIVSFISSFIPPTKKKKNNHIFFFKMFLPISQLYRLPMTFSPNTVNEKISRL